MSPADQWRATRRYLNSHRHELAGMAGSRYRALPHVAGTGLLCRESWLPAKPIDLDAVSLRWRPDCPPPAVTGTGGLARRAFPQATGGARFQTYAEAVAGLDRPALFENRVSYRLLDARVGPAGADAGGADAGGAGAGGGRAVLTFGTARYFDGTNVGEAVAHEFAEAVRAGERDPDPRDLPLRTAVGDPTDLARRPVLPAISVLTLRWDRRSGETTFVLHRRDPNRVAHGGGLSHVMPVGVFQPSADGATAMRRDFDLWRCVVREYSEEFLGGSENYGDGRVPFDYDSLPCYRSLTGAKDRGLVRVFLLGLGVDPLSFATDLLAVAVIDAAVFDDVFAAAVTRNAEGTVLRNGGATGFTFTGDTIRTLPRRIPMQAAGAAAVTLAWRHRATILAPRG